MLDLSFAYQSSKDIATAVCDSDDSYLIEHLTNKIDEYKNTYGIAPNKYDVQVMIERYQDELYGE